MNDERRITNRHTTEADAPLLFRWTSRKVIYIALVVAFTTCVLGMAYTAPRSSALTTEISRSETIRNAYKSLFIELLNVETGARGYVITGQERFLEPYYSGSRASASYEDRLKKEPRGDDEAAFINNLVPLIDGKIANTIETVNVRRFQGKEVAEQRVSDGEGKAIMDQIRKSITDFDEANERRLREKHDDADYYTNLTTWEFFIAVLSFIALIIMLASAPSPPAPEREGVFPWRGL